MLSGFLAPDGNYIECESYAHMDTATKIVEQLFPEESTGSGMRDERLLVEEKGYVAFYARGAAFRSSGGRLLTDEQKGFLEGCAPNNDDQKKSIDMILSIDTDRREDSVLSRYEEKLGLS